MSHGGENDRAGVHDGAVEVEKNGAIAHGTMVSRPSEAAAPTGESAEDWYEVVTDTRRFVP
jgi:hypothetical protein